MNWGETARSGFNTPETRVGSKFQGLRSQPVELERQHKTQSEGV